MHVQNLHRLALLAAEAGLQKSTVHSAASDGRLRVYRTACGLQLATRDDFEAWLATWRPRPFYVRSTSG